VSKYVDNSVLDRSRGR